MPINCLFSKFGIAVAKVLIDSLDPEWQRAIEAYQSAVKNTRDVPRQSVAEYLRKTSPELCQARDNAIKAQSQYCGSVLKLGNCDAATLHVPRGAKQQTIRFLAAPSEHGKDFFPVVDPHGKPVELAVVPGCAYVLPPAIMRVAFLKLEGSDGQNFEATVVVRGREYTGSQGQAVAVLPASPGTQHAEISLGNTKGGYLLVGADASPQVVSVCVGGATEFHWQEQTYGERARQASGVGQGNLHKPENALLQERPLQLIDGSGSPVTIRVEPGKACPLPPSLIGQPFAAFVAERKAFQAKVSLV